MSRESDASSRSTSTLDHAFAGQIAGMIGLTLVHPLDTVKARVQTNALACTSRIVRMNVRPFDVARDVFTRDGVKGFYRGVAAPMLAYGAINAVSFSAESATRELTRERFGSDVADGVYGRLASGSVAGFMSSFVRAPAERVKTVQQVIDCEGKRPSTAATARALTRQHGVVRGLFTGTWSTITREVPQYAIYFLTYDVIKARCETMFLGDARDAREVPYGARAASVVLAGGSAGALIWLVTYPLDVCKTRIQASRPGTYGGVIDCAMKSVASEGPMVLLRGLGVALLRAFPLHAAIFASCETVHATLAHVRRER